MKWNLFVTQEGVIRGMTLQEPHQEARRIGLRTETAALKKVQKRLETSSRECIFEDCLKLKARIHITWWTIVKPCLNIANSTIMLLRLDANRYLNPGTPTPCSGTQARAICPSLLPLIKRYQLPRLQQNKHPSVHDKYNAVAEYKYRDHHPS